MGTQVAFASPDGACPNSFCQIRGRLVTIVGFALIAVSYGLVRFSYGQFLPAIRAELGLSETLAGVISSALFVGNCAALLIAAYACERYGPRVVAFTSAVMACAGLAVMSLAPSAMAFAAALMVAGTSAGLSFPPFVVAVMQTVRPERRERATSIINAGTCAGIVISGPIAMYMAGDWRMAFGGFAVIALIVAVCTFVVLPRHAPALSPKAARERIWTHPRIRPILLSSLALGAASAVFWTFGGEIVASLSQWHSGDISMLWIVMGATGFVAAFAGTMVDRWSLDTVHKTGFVLLAAAIILLSMTHLINGAATLAAGAFGAAYMILTAVYVIWSMRLSAHHAAIVCAASFFMLPLGQIGGSVVIGYGLQTLGTEATLNLVALFVLMISVMIPARPAQATEILVLASDQRVEPEPAPAFVSQRARRSKLFFLHPRRAEPAKQALRA